MLSRLKSLFSPSHAPLAKIAFQPPGIPFPWPRMTCLTVLEDLMLAIPAAAIANDEKIGSVIHAHPDAEIRIPTSPSDSLIHLRLKAGMSVWLSKSVEGVVVADDKRPRRIEITTIQNEKSA